MSVPFTAPYIPSPLGSELSPNMSTEELVRILAASAPPRLLGQPMGRPSAPPMAPMQNPRLSQIDAERAALNAPPKNGPMEFLQSLVSGINIMDPMVFAQMQQRDRSEAANRKAERERLLMAEQQGIMDRQRQGEMDAITKRRAAMEEESFPVELGLKQAELLRSGQPPPRNIDPLSEEGILARARLEELTRQPASPTQLPGRDVPYSPEVLSQLKDLRQPATPASEPLVQTQDEQGNTVYTPRSQAAGMKAPKTPQQTKPPTGQQRDALRYYLRAENAVKELETVEQEIAKLGLGGQARLDQAPNWLQSNAGKTYNIASKQFTEARLRKDSGAAIHKDEYANDRMMYFAVPGDGPEQLAQKKRARQAVMDGLKQSAAGAYTEHFGEQDSGAAPIVQQNKKTGEFRHSIDGGKTWRNGKPQ